MRKIHTQRLDMYEAVLALFQRETTTVALIPGLSARSAVFSTKVSNLRKKTDEADRSSRNITLAKNEKKDRAVKLALAMSKKLKILSKVKDSPALMDDIYLTESSLKKGTEAELNARMGVVLSRCKSLEKGDGEAEGITAAAITDLEKAITDFGSAKGAPRKKIDQVAGENAVLLDAFREMQDYFDTFIKTPIESEEVNQPAFLVKFRQAAKVKETGGGSRDKNGEEPSGEAAADKKEVSKATA